MDPFGIDVPGSTNNISPLPSNCSAPPWSKIVRESTLEDTRKDILEGILAFISPVITSTDGRCVAITRWILKLLLFAPILQ